MALDQHSSSWSKIYQQLPSPGEQAFNVLFPEHLSVLSEQTWLEYLPMAACYLDRDLKVMDFTRSFMAFSGLAPAAIYKQPINIFLRPSPKTQVNIYDLIKQGFAFEAVFLSVDHQETSVKVMVSAYPRGVKEPSGYLLAFSSISQDQKTLRSLEERVMQMQRYADDLEKTRKVLLNILEDVEQERKIATQERDRNVAIVRHFADGIMILEQQKIILVNPVFERFFNVNVRELLEKNILDFIHHKNLQGLVQLLSQESFILDRHELLINPNLAVEVSTILMFETSEEPKRMMIVIHDVTREKVVEQLKTDFVSLAAHQLRTPLSIIKWSMRSILDGDFGKLTSDQLEFFNKIDQTNERMIRLVNDLLNAARIEEGRYVYKTEKHDVVEVVKQVVEALQSMAQGKGVVLVFDDAALKGRSYPEIDLDVEKMGIVFHNLVENGLSYNHKGGRVDVLVDYRVEAKEFLFTIKDTGMGIPLAESKRLFSRFFRASNAVRADTEGTGLGLFISRNIVEGHGGKLWFETKEGQGTTFFVSLPCKEAEV